MSEIKWTCYIGLTLKEAEEKAKLDNLETRVISLTGKGYSVVMNFSARRLGFVLKDGKVVSCIIG